MDDETAARTDTSDPADHLADRERWRPVTVAEVVDCVRQARARGLQLYPMGVAGVRSMPAPPRGTVVLDLSLMNRILNAADISEGNPVAVIEPGVTEQQLHEFLQERQPRLDFNRSGATPRVSVLDEAFDRAAGSLGPLQEEVFALEAVLGTGEILQTGFRRLGEQSPLAYTHPWGLGPMLDGLFFQGNFGIVTSACLRLLTRPRQTAVVSLALQDKGRLADFLDRLVLLKRLQVIGSATHVGYALGMPPGPAASELQGWLRTSTPRGWTARTVIGGSPGQVRAAIAEVRRVLGGIAICKVRDDAAEVITPALMPTQAQALPEGRIVLYPALPMMGAQAVGILQAMEAQAVAFGHTLSMTLALQAQTSLAAAVEVNPGPDPNAALHCARALLMELRSRGLEVYRPPVGMPDDVVDRVAPFWHTISSLKRVLDPDNVIAPGRYALARSRHA